MKRIKKEDMDAVDQQQQAEIDTLREESKSKGAMVWGLIWLSLVIAVVNFGSFIFAMTEMAKAIEALKK